MDRARRSLRDTRRQSMVDYDPMEPLLLAAAADGLVPPLGRPAVRRHSIAAPGYEAKSPRRAAPFSGGLPPRAPFTGRRAGERRRKLRGGLQVLAPTGGAGTACPSHLLQPAPAPHARLHTMAKPLRPSDPAATATGAPPADLRAPAEDVPLYLPLADEGSRAPRPIASAQPIDRKSLVGGSFFKAMQVRT